MGQCVYVVDDDEGTLHAIDRLLRPLGYDVALFEDAAQFLEHADIGSDGCLILDVRLPGTSGLAIQRQLIAKSAELPIVFITGYPDVVVAVQAMKAGAVDFLQKPFREQQLLDAVNEALETNADRQAFNREAAADALAYRALSPTERDIMRYVTAGLLNKQIAARTGRSENTVKVHRWRIMRKMKARSLADLVRLADRLGINRDTLGETN